MSSFSPFSKEELFPQAHQMMMGIINFQYKTEETTLLSINF